MNNQKGSMLVAIIAMMVVIAVLGAGMLVINGTSFMTAAKSSNFSNALYLAEAGIRYGQSGSFPFTTSANPNGTLFKLADGWQQMIVKKDSNGNITSTGIVYPGTALEARMTLTWLKSGGGNQPVNPTDTRNPTGGNPNNLIAANPSTFTGGDLSVFNLTGIPGRVAIQAYITGSGTHAYWAALQNFASNAAPNGEQLTCNISYLFVPISQTYVDNLRNVYNCNGYVSYQMATKVGWLNTLNYAAQGINFRWHESSAGSGLYQGYGLSFMIFESQTGCSTDYIPNSIKPGTSDALSGKLLLVLWKQWVEGVVEKRKWLAYAEMGKPGPVGTVCTPPNIRTSSGTCTATGSSIDNDPMVTGGQDGYDGRVDDDATIGVRIEDIIQGGVHHNEIKVFYGDASPYFDTTSPRRTPDEFATNTNRQRYFPQWVSSTYFTTWPSHNFENFASTDNTLTYWSYTGWLPSTPYIRNPNSFDTGEIVIPTIRPATGGQDAHNYIVTQADSCTCTPTPSLCPAACTCPAPCAPMNCSISGTTEPVWPTSGTVTDGTSSPLLIWQEHGIGRPTARYDWFTVLSANPKGTNNSVIWVPNPAATEITLDINGDRSTIKTSEFLLDSFPVGRQEIGMHGMTNADFVPLSFDDLSISIMGSKE